MSIFVHRIGIQPKLLAPMASITQEGSATSTTATITGPATIQAGDILILLDRANNAFIGTPAAVIPTGFTPVSNISGGTAGARQIISHKIADGSEASASITGMAVPLGGSARKALYVFRGDEPAISVQFKGVAGQVTDGNPTPQVQPISAETVPLVVIGGYGSSAAIDPRTWTPGAKGGEINPATNLYLGYQIFNSSPADTTIDMDDEGNNNGLQSCYFIPFRVLEA